MSNLTAWENLSFSDLDKPVSIENDFHLFYLTLRDTLTFYVQCKEVEGSGSPFWELGLVKSSFRIPLNKNRNLGPYKTPRQACSATEKDIVSYLDACLDQMKDMMSDPMFDSDGGCIDENC